MGPQSERDEVQRSACRLVEMFDHECFYVYILSCCHCQEFKKKHYIVVIKKVGAWRCRSDAILPTFEIRYHFKQ